MIISVLIAYSLSVKLAQAAKRYFNAENEEESSGNKLHESAPTQSADLEVSQQTSGSSTEEELVEDGSVTQQSPGSSAVEELEVTDVEVRTEEINNCQYEIGEMLGEGRFGAVYDGRRVQDGLKVAVKFVEKDEGENDECVEIPDHSGILPMEIGLQMMVNREPRVPEILQLLDWEDHADHYIMVLEHVSPCMDLANLIESRGPVTENVARTIMRQAVTAAHECCQRGVFHGDIRLDNLLMNTKTLEVKLIDFGCGSLYTDSVYETMPDTPAPYLCPEAVKKGKYRAGQMTVYSLGVVLFILISGKSPVPADLFWFNNDTFFDEGWSKECYSLIQACMWNNPKRRIKLAKMLEHRWFQVTDDEAAVDIQNPVDNGSGSGKH